MDQGDITTIARALRHAADDVGDVLPDAPYLALSASWVERPGEGVKTMTLTASTPDDELADQVDAGDADREACP